MFGRALTVALLLAGCATPAAPQADAHEQQAAWAAQCADDSGWDDPGPPFSVWGNTYYVGTCGITAILVTGDQGHVLIDGGTEKGASLVAHNIEALGFDLADIKIILTSHEHHDHVGGVAELQRRTGATLYASALGAIPMGSGKASRDDPQYEIAVPFPPAKLSNFAVSGTPVTLGSLSLMPLATPGHTPGATTWYWNACEANDCKRIVYADSLSPVSADSYRFTEHPGYVGMFRTSLARLAQLECDILLTPHPAASDMRTRLLAGSLVDVAACKAYADSRSKLLDERLAKEAGE